jgi:hypothetical protein
VYLAIDEWVSAGDTVGTPEPYHSGGTLGACVGLPADVWRSGFNTASTADHIVLTLDNTAQSFMAKTLSVGSTLSGLYAGAAFPLWSVLAVGGNFSVRAYNSGSTLIGQADVSLGANGSVKIVCGETDGASVTARVYDGAGAEVVGSPATASYAAQTQTGTHYAGVNTSKALTWAQPVDAIVALDGATMGATTAQSLATDLAGAWDIDTLATDYAASLATDGLVSGVKLAAAVPGGAFPLIYADGSGAAVTAEAA